MIPFAITVPGALTREARSELREQVLEAMRRRLPLVLTDGATIQRIDRPRVTSSFLRRAATRMAPR